MYTLGQVDIFFWFVVCNIQKCFVNNNTCINNNSKSFVCDSLANVCGRGVLQAVLRGWGFCMGFFQPVRLLISLTAAPDMQSLLFCFTPWVKYTFRPAQSQLLWLSPVWWLGAQYQVRRGRAVGSEHGCLTRRMEESHFFTLEIAKSGTSVCSMCHSVGQAAKQWSSLVLRSASR